MTQRLHLTIGEVLSLLREEFPDVSISKIRFLESQGLVDPERTPSGYRKFYDHDVDRLRWILRQQREHFLPLKVIRGRLTGQEGDMSEPDLVAGAGQEADPGSVAMSVETFEEITVEEMTVEKMTVERITVEDSTSEPAAVDETVVVAFVDPDGSEEVVIIEDTIFLDEAVPGSEAAPAPAGSDGAAQAFHRADTVGDAEGGAGAEGGADPDGDGGPERLFASPEAAPGAGSGSAAPKMAAPRSPAARSSATRAAAPRPAGSKSAASRAGAAKGASPADPAAAATVPTATVQGGEGAGDMGPVDPASGGQAGDMGPGDTVAGDAAPAEVVAGDSTAGADATAGAAPTAGVAPDGAAQDVYTVAELADAAGCTPQLIRDLQQFGILVAASEVNGKLYFEPGAVALARVGARFDELGVEPRHLRTWRNAADREAGLFEQLVMPLLRQRNPQSRRQAAERLDELSDLGGRLRAGLLAEAVRQIK